MRPPRPALAETDTPGAGNQPAILSSASVVLTETNSLRKPSGRLSISDADSPQRFVAQKNVAGTSGTFNINSAGAWTYITNSVLDRLNVGQSVSDSFTVASADGTSTSVQLTIYGSNDAAVLGAASVVLTETDVALSASGRLSIRDVDNAATFVVQSDVSGTNGSFSIDSVGVWSYQANSILDNLNAGQSVSDSFTVSSEDGTTTTVKVTIKGSNDAAVLGAASVVLTETNEVLSTEGSLSISDVDSPAAFVARKNAAGAIGTFSIDAAGAWTYVTKSALDRISEGKSVSDSFTVASADGTKTTVLVTINGTNDAAVLSASDVALKETNAALKTTGRLNIKDVDSPQTFVAQSDVAGANGSFSIDTSGRWTYVAKSSFDDLNDGQSVSDSFKVVSSDGTATAVKVTIKGSNDAAILGTASVALDETNAPLSTTGKLTISDVDSALTFVARKKISGVNGNLSIDGSGRWSYVANSAFSNLNVGQSISDSFTVASADGTATTVQVTINGTNDAAILGAASIALDETNAPLSAAGTLTIRDVDSPPTFVADRNVAGANGTFSIDSAGAWTYAANSAFDSLNVGQSVSDSFTVVSSDGTTTTVQITINGTNDAAILSPALVVLDETNAPLSTGGTLSISDVDSPPAFVAQSNAAGANGTFGIDTAGAWTYVANSAFDSLLVGQSISDSFTVASADGTTTAVQITINGTNEAAILSSANVVLTETDAILSTGGTLTISDVDSPETFVAQTNVAGANGTFNINSAGLWTYVTNSAL